MADKWPLANGNWSSAANWNGGTKPVAGDTVYADGKTITIDEDIDLSPGGSLNTTQRSGGTAGGLFSVATARSITANIVAGSSTCISDSHTIGTVTITGNISGSATTSNVNGLYKNSNSATTVVGNITAGTLSSSHGVYLEGGVPLTVIGNVSGNTGSNYAISAQSNNTITITGNVTGGGSASVAMFIASPLSLTITGTVTGGSTNSTRCLWFLGNYTAFTINGNVIGGASGQAIILQTSGTNGTINGNVIGGPGTTAIGTAGACSFTINGNCTGSSTASGAYGVELASSASLTINGGAIGGASGAYGVYSTTGNSLSVTIASAELGGVGIWWVSSGTAKCKYFKCSPNGLWPILGTVLVDLQSDTYIETRTSPSKSVFTFTNPDNTAGLLPSVTDVRSGVSYNVGNNTGTCAVPAPINVTSGVLVDNTVGTAILTEQTIRSAMGLSAANLDTKFNNLSTQIGTLLSNSPTEAF